MHALLHHVDNHKINNPYKNIPYCGFTLIFLRKTQMLKKMYLWEGLSDCNLFFKIIS